MLELGPLKNSSFQRFFGFPRLLLEMIQFYVVVSNMFLFSTLPGEMIHLDEHIFQMGWNHQLEMVDIQIIRYYIPWKVLDGLQKMIQRVRAMKRLVHFQLDFFWITKVQKLNRWLLDSPIEWVEQWFVSVFDTSKCLDLEGFWQMVLDWRDHTVCKARLP